MRVFQLEPLFLKERGLSPTGFSGHYQSRKDCFGSALTSGSSPLKGWERLFLATRRGHEAPQLHVAS
jgi:hypothetical protein